MVRIRLKGVNCATKVLADGRRVTYWYAWRGGPQLRGEPGTPEFVASYNEAVARKVLPPRGKLLSVCCRPTRHPRIFFGSPTAHAAATWR
jgi:hypothetical protein